MVEAAERNSVLSVMRANVLKDAVQPELFCADASPPSPVQLPHRTLLLQHRSLTIPPLHPRVSQLVLFGLVCSWDFGIHHTSTFFYSESEASVLHFLLPLHPQTPSLKKLLPPRLLLLASANQL